MLVSIILFSMEVLVGSVVLEDFKYTFFFYLDVIATVSLVNDIPLLLDPLLLIIGSQPENLSVNAIPGVMVSQSTTTGKLQQLVKSIRLIRLIRIIKLYKYIIKSKQASEDRKLK